MKTKAFLLAIMLVCPILMLADETKVQIHPASGSGTLDVVIGYNGNQALYISKDKFSANDAAAGHIVRVNGWLTGEGAHKLLVGAWVEDASPVTEHLPGSDYRNITSLPFDIYLTQDMLDAIVTGNKDFRVYGEGMTLNVADLVKPGKAGALHDGFRTIWTGYFWADEWKTLELYKEAFSVVDLSKYAAIRFYHEAGRDNFTMNLFCANTGSGLTTPLCEASGIHKTPTCVDVPLTDAIRTALSGLSNALYIQLDKGTGAAFNLTDIVLIPKNIDGCDNCFHVIY